jgi:predicted NACHT family NTPase
MALIELFIGKAVDIAVKVWDKKTSSKGKPKHDFKQTTSITLSEHLKYLSNWSENIQLITLGKSQNVDSQSIELEFDSTPRRYRSTSTKSEKKDEKSLVLADCNYLLIGDPGSGKTTTLKRIVRNMLLTESTCGQDIFSFPILLRLKEFNSKDNVYDKIAAILGFQIDSIEVKSSVTMDVGQIEDVINSYRRDEKTGVATPEGKMDEVKKTVTRTVSHFIPYIGGIPLKDFISNYIDEATVLLLIDGYDELESFNRERVEKDIETLARSLTRSKIIMTCRSGHCSGKSIEGFEMIEILPLERGQIEIIASQWLV